MSRPEANRTTLASRASSGDAAPPGRTPVRLAAIRFMGSKSALVGGIALLAIGLSVIMAPWLSPVNPVTMNAEATLAPPGSGHLMGTDRFGRDILSRVLWGGRVSLPVGFVSVAIAGVFGVPLGLVAGYTGGRTDTAIMRLVDLMLAFPSILLALAIVALLGGSLINLMIAVGISTIPTYVRLTRGTVLGVREQEFVIAARAIGCRDHTIILRHILPNVTAPLVVLSTLNIARALITGAALSFLGLGIRPPTPEWGKMLSEGQEFLQYASWIALFPGLAIMVTVLAINLLGDGLRDALDPRMHV